jgi:hypothetical protein
LVVKVLHLAHCRIEGGKDYRFGTSVLEHRAHVGLGVQVMLGEDDLGILGKQLELAGAVEVLLRFGPRCCQLMEGLVDVLG